MNDSIFIASFIVQPGDLQAALQQNLGFIEALQSGPVMPETPVIYPSELQPFGRYAPGDGRPERIEISRFGPHPRLTLSHEIGHLLDHAISGYNEYASARQDSPLHKVMEAIQGTEAYRMLQRHTVLNGQNTMDLLAQRRAKYWLKPTELWARAYAQ